ncbi:hypothetical protein MY4824_006142 [Beauveria thailandica]
MRASAILAAAAACSVIAAPIESRENGEPNLLGGFNIPGLGAAGQEGFATFAGFLDNLFNGAIFSPVSKVLQGQPVGAAEDAVTGLVKTGTNLVKNIGATGMAGLNGYNPTAKSQADLAKGAAAAGVNVKSGQGAPSQQSQQAAQSAEQKTEQQPEQPAPANGTQGQ